MQCLKEDFGFWKDVIFTDESKFNIFASDGRTSVWLNPNDEINVKNLRSTVKYGRKFQISVSILVSGVGKGLTNEATRILSKFQF